MTTTTTHDLRGRREQLDVSRVSLAIKSGVSPAWLQTLEAGLQPAGSRALARVEHALEQLEADRAAWQPDEAA